MNMQPLVLGLVLVTGLSSVRLFAEDNAEQLTDSFQQQVKPFLRQHCVRCHNAEEMTSGIRVDHLDAAFEDRHWKLWAGIRKQIEAAAMPPEDEPQPTDDERRQIIGWIDQALDLARSRPTPKNGGSRRLTVAQYRNTLRELLRIDDDLTEALPRDAVSRDGFVNNQETLALSPLLLEAYIEIAEEALERCLVDPKSKPKIQNFRVDLGAGVNPDPCPDNLILGAFSHLLKNDDFVVTQMTAKKPFDFEPFFMRTKYRFIEGYQGNDTVRGWREYDSIYHAVFACMRGTDGYPKGLAYSTVPEGLLLRPAIPSHELFGVDSTYGPRANFKISLRELPDEGQFRVTVTAAKYRDGLLLDPGAPSMPDDSPNAVACRDPSAESTVTISKDGIYQVDVFAPSRETPDGDDAKQQSEKKPRELRLKLGDREFIGLLQQPAFLVVRLSAGELPIRVQRGETNKLDRIVFTLLDADHELAGRFTAFEQRSPQLGVHVGLRRDCGSTFAQVGPAQPVKNDSLTQYMFEGAIRNFPSPDVEKDNVNYLAGVREIAVHSEYTDSRDMPRLLIRSVEFEGPYYESWPPESHRNIFIESNQPAESPEYAREIIRSFTGRAFRRPVTAEEENALQDVFRQSFDGGASFQESVRDALQVVLTAPQFLFLTENSHTPEPEPLSGNELASKLSYFLWNGPPDERLLELAAAGTLHDQLAAETKRMIDDPRFTLFTSEFVSQWLLLEKFDVLEPDRSRFPKLTRDARSQLRQEPVRFVEHLIRHNLPVRNLLDSEFVLANDVVAAYYDLADKPDTGFEFAAIPRQRPELGGVLSQAAILAGLSDGREPNPVKRGAWFARKIIAEPPDDPPPNVPALREETTNLSLRERLELHRNQPGCAQCHSKIDPWGLPFEEFDAGGRLISSPVDARSVLPDETEVAGLKDLQRYLVEDRSDQVAFSVVKHLTIYATGRSLGYRELELLKHDLVKLKPDGYRLRDMIQYVVHSPMFLEK